MADRRPVLVLAPHPDDDVLGAGGAIARMSDEGREVFVAVVTVGRPPDYPPSYVARVREEARAAHADLGVRETFWLDQPAAGTTMPGMKTAVSPTFRLARYETRTGRSVPSGSRRSVR